MILRFSPFLLLVASLLGGCASVLNKGPQSLTLSSEPSGATVYVNGNERGTTPFTYAYAPEDGDVVQFELRREGHRNASLTLRPERNNGVLFADAMLLGIPWIADRKSPALYRMPSGDHTVQLFREAKADQVRHLVPVAAVDVEMPTNSNLGQYANKPIKRGADGVFRELEYGDQMSGSVTGALKETWIDARIVRPGTTKGDELLQRAKLYMRPRITAIKADLKGKNNTCQGPVEMDMEWRFISAIKKDSVLFTVNTHVTHEAMGTHVSQVVPDAIALSARRMAEDPALEERIAAAYGSGLSLSKGSQVEVKAPVAIAFNGRKEMLSALVKAVVTVQTDDGHGSGFLITNDGYMLTNEHVVGKEGIVKVKFEQGMTLDAQVVKVNRDFDLALLKVGAADLPALSIGDDKALMLGEEIFAIGTPLDASLGQSVSRGILSGKRELESRTYLQTDVSINPGNSGGPFIDETGKVVGVATMKISGKGLEGLGFGVPISVALEMLNITVQP